MTRKTAIAVPFIWMLLFFPFNLSLADNAEVLPKGITRLGLNSIFYFPVDEQYNDDSDAEDIATDYNANLNSRIFPDLALIEQAFAMPQGSASIGNSVVSMEYDFYLYDLTFEYGLTDKLTIGAKIPYWHVKNDVNARVSTSNATVGINPNFGLPGDPFGVPLIPISFGGIQDDALATEFVQNFLVQDFGFKRVKSWSESGFSDIEVGARYQYLKTKNWRLAFTGAVRLPTGETDDPDNLMDYGFGTGAWAFLFNFNNDYIGIKNTTLNITLKYNLYISDHEVLRVPDDVNQPITPNKEKVDRDIGDAVEITTSAGYQFCKGSTGYLEYAYMRKFEDSVSGNRGYAYDQLEAESDLYVHVYKVGLSYSTIPLYQEKKFALPLDFSVMYRNRFAGKNVLKSQYIQLAMTVYF